jgi:hypothetical protein
MTPPSFILALLLKNVIRVLVSVNYFFPSL